MEPIRLGPVPSGLGTPDQYITVEFDEEPLLRIDLYSEFDVPDYWQDLSIWRQYVVIAWGNRLYVVDVFSRNASAVDLDQYFERVYPADDYLLVATNMRLI